jgi:hypothetical protein
MLLGLPGAFVVIVMVSVEFVFPATLAGATAGVTVVSVASAEPLASQASVARRNSQTLVGRRDNTGRF